MPENEAVREARQLFAGEGLPFPALPPGLLGEFRNLGPWVYGTRPAPRSLYDIEAYVREVESQAAADYVLLGHAGHGTQSWGIHLYLVHGRLAVFLQAAWGGAYMDRDEATHSVAAKFQQAAELERTMQFTHRNGRRLIVVASDFQLSRWRWLETAPDRQAEPPQWVEAYDALAEAAALLKSAPDPA